MRGSKKDTDVQKNRTRKSRSEEPSILHKFGGNTQSKSPTKISERTKASVNRKNVGNERAPGKAKQFTGQKHDEHGKERAPNRKNKSKKANAGIGTSKKG